jgi:transcriptional regulator with XRE-family HTH domain
MDIGKRLRAARLKRGLSQEEVAAQAGTSQATVSFTESGQRIGLTTLAIAEVLEVPLTLREVRNK